jgi:hypothetical protein
MAKHKHIGSSFESFLEEEGILEDSKQEAAKRVVAWQLEEELRKQHLLDELNSLLFSGFCNGHNTHPLNSYWLLLCRICA